MPHRNRKMHFAARSVEQHGISVAAWRRLKSPELWGRNPMTHLMAGMQMSDVASFIKHPSFCEEREWRVVIQFRNQVHYRSGGSFLVPFAELPLGLKATRALVDVVVGPTPHPALAVESVKAYLHSKLGYEVPVRASDIPFRAW